MAWKILRTFGKWFAGSSPGRTFVRHARLSVERLEDRIAPVVDGVVVDANFVPWSANQFDGAAILIRLPVAAQGETLHCAPSAGPVT